jgi:hypothetical protein
MSLALLFSEVDTPVAGENTEQNADAKETHRALYGFRGVYVLDRLFRDLRSILCALDVCRECHFREPPR